MTHSPRLPFALAALGLAALTLPGQAAPTKAHPAKRPVSKPMPHTTAAPVVRMVTAKGIILIKLFPKDAPITVAKFEALVRKGFYNGLTLHRITDLADPGASKIVQGGDPAGNGQGGPGYTIKGEFTANGVNNPLTHEAGAVAMAREGAPPDAPQAEQVRAFNSAGSQFYICVNPVHFLDGKYAVFGKVIKGLDVAGKLQVGDKMTKVTMAQ